MKGVQVVIVVLLLSSFADGKKERKFNKKISNHVKENDVKPYYDIMLPKYVKPVHYDVFLNVNMTTKLVDGKVAVNISTTKPTLYIIIHAAGYKSLTGKIYDKRNLEIKVKRQFFFAKNQYFVMKVNQELSAGEYELRYVFKYTLKKKLAGFYQATYKTDEGSVKMAAVTQFQPTDARLAFPCFDEPRLRATFDITIGHDKSYTALSNMPVEFSTYDDSTTNIRYDKFQRTPLISTYILTFAVCQFSHVTVLPKMRNNVTMSFYAPPSKIDQITYATNAGAKILPFYESYFNVPYPLPKADMLAVPDFALNGMENWGLVSCRMKGLLYNSQTLPLSSKIYVSELIAHELAHQWFGNLVTMYWWSDLWLNEGFASHMTFKGVNAVNPDWHFGDFQVVVDVNSALELDSLVTSHPIYVKVTNPAQINEAFDAISYKKGSSVLRMLEHFLGEQNFLKGLNRYLKKYAYKNAKSKDLWEALSEESSNDFSVDNTKYNVSEIMNTWVLQKNYPCVHVKRTANGTLLLTQSRFLSNPNAKDEEKSLYDFKWHIPFSYKTFQIINGSKVESVADDSSAWLKLGDQDIGTVPRSSFIKGNLGQYGFYRVNYDPEDWQKIIHLLNTDHHQLDVKDRAGLIQDVFALAASRRTSYDIAFSLLTYIENDSDYIPWQAMKNSLDKLSPILLQSPRLHTLFKRFIKTKATKLFNRFGFRDDIKDNFLSRNLQTLVAEHACASGHVTCLRQADFMFQSWMENKTRVPADFKRLVYSHGVRNGDEKEWNHVMQEYLRTNLPYEKFTLLEALCATQQPDIIDQMLYNTLNSTIVKSQDVFYVFRYIVGSSAHGRYHAWYFLKENWKHVVSRFAHQFHTLERIVRDVVSGFSTEHALNQVVGFFKKDGLVGVNEVKRTLKQSVESVRSNILWLNNNKQLIERWLKANVESKVSNTAL